MSGVSTLSGTKLTRRMSLSFKAARKVSDQVICAAAPFRLALGGVALARPMRAGRRVAGDDLAAGAGTADWLSERGRPGGQDLALEGSERRKPSLSIGRTERPGRGAAA